MARTSTCSSSYETAPSDRSGYTTLIANYQPLQDTYGGPNYFNLDPDALYEIHIDNDGDGIEDLTFQFDFDLNLANNGTGVELPIGGKQHQHPAPGRGRADEPERSRTRTSLESYTLGLVRGPRRATAATLATNLVGQHDDVREAVRQRRHEDDRELRHVLGEVHLQLRRPRLHADGRRRRHARSRVRRSAPGRLRRQPRRDLRPRQPPRRGARRQHAGGLGRPHRRRRIKGRNIDRATRT